MTGSLWRAALPVLAVVAVVAGIGSTLAVAGDTLGYDYQAYVRAAERILDGAPLYDPAVDVAGGFAIFLYPPPFALALIPFALVPPEVGLWAWLALCVAAFVAGVALLPVRPTVRWAVLLLGGLYWPVAYAIKLGQVGPLLFVLFALGWRQMARPGVLGATMAFGALVKVQPVIMLGWAVLTGRWQAAAIAVALLAAAAALATVVLGPGVWTDYLALLGRVSAPITTPHNFTLGAVAFQLGAAEAVATIVQVAWLAGIVLVVLLAIRFGDDDVSYVTTAAASQMLSPLLWDHYAIVLLLPVAWLLQRGHTWALAIPLAAALPLASVVPPLLYPLLFTLALVAPLAVHARGRASATVGP